MRAALTAVALWIALCATAAADVYDDNPATASRGPGDMWVFARGADGATLERHWTGSAWTDWSSLGGVATSGPAAVGYGNTVLVFARGTDGAIHQTSYVDNAWTGWTSLGGFTTSAPSVSVRRGSPGYVDLATKGGDNTIYFQSFVPTQGWSGWSSLGGNLSSAPALNSHADGIVNVFARGTDGAIAQKAFNGAQWVDWGSLGGVSTTAPAAVSRAQDLVNLYVRGTDSATYQRAWVGGVGWSDWMRVDAAPIDSAPAAGGDGASHEWLFARRGAGLSRKEWNAGSGWTAWIDMGPVAVPPPAAPAPPAPAPDGEVSLETGVRCTPPGGRLRVQIKVRKPAGQAKARVTKIVFFTKGKGRSIRVDRKSPFVVRMKVNRPAGSTGRVYARVYYRRSAKDTLHRKTVSRRYTVCR